MLALGGGFHSEDQFLWIVLVHESEAAARENAILLPEHASTAASAWT
jgi:hypothetical protein